MLFTKELAGICVERTQPILIQIPRALHSLETLVVWSIDIYFTFVSKFKFIQFSTEKLPTALAIEKTKQLLACGVKLGELNKDYILLGARQVTSTEDPGLELYSEIQDWDHWASSP